MKSVGVVMLFVLLRFTAFAQQYQPLLSESNEWHFSNCFNGCASNTYLANDDTIVGGIDFKILDGYHYISRTFLLREDIFARKVYLMKVSPTKNDEYLLYDFSMNIGDTIDIENPISPFPSNGGFFKLDSIAPRTLSDGNLYNHFYLSPTASNSVSSLPSIWVESVGSLSLINAPGGHPDINGVGQLSCHFKTGDLHYANYDSISDCSLQYDVSVTNIENVSFSIYPTIVDEYLNIDVESNACQFIITSIEGKMIQNGTLRSGKNEISLQIIKGVYIVSVINENAILGTVKVVKK